MAGNDIFHKFSTFIKNPVPAQDEGEEVGGPPVLCHTEEPQAGPQVLRPLRLASPSLPIPQRPGTPSPPPQCGSAQLSQGTLGRTGRDQPGPGKNNAGTRAGWQRRLCGREGSAKLRVPCLQQGAALTQRAAAHPAALQRSLLRALLKLDEYLSAPLEYELACEPHLRISQRRFLDGDQLTLADCNLLPKLNIVQVSTGIPML